MKIAYEWRNRYVEEPVVDCSYFPYGFPSNTSQAKRKS